ncbi:unnamed protein product [Brassica rapa subsp. narinosa]|uniref:(rape) hypothetical protein n=1 Tax=Brassica napus TaxID=3708 RepID=A0A816T8K6_BRANA|nr:unnamed protein product [Brassica napus]
MLSLPKSHDTEEVGFDLDPRKVCSQIGLCGFDGSHSVSMGIKSVVEDGVSGLLNEAMWSACEMSSVWMQSELSQNQTQERILAYAAEACEDGIKVSLSYYDMRT